MKPAVLRFTLVGACASLLAACGDTAPPKSASPPPPEVAVVTVHPQSVPLTRELVGRLAPTRVAEVRARVAGIVLERTYTEGTDVKKGDVLFRIDPAPLEAALHAQEAALARARAEAANAALLARRYRDLAEKHLLSAQDLDTALANERTAAAAVREAQARVEQAKLDLGYATVSAPIDGRAGRALVTEGALVGEGEATWLTSVEQIDPIYANFSRSVNELQELQHNAGQSLVPGGGKVEVSMPNGEPYPQAGTLDFSDLSADPGTGTVSLRAVVPNPDRLLLPGMFVQLRLTMGQLAGAFLLPQAAVQRDGAGAYVLVVDAEGKVEQRRVETRGVTRTDWIVSGGLADGDQVIVEGVQKVRPGGMAKAVAAGTGAAKTAPAAGKS
jgi:membrane fusion protein (multidrug efflux system)